MDLFDPIPGAGALNWQHRLPEEMSSRELARLRRQVRSFGGSLQELALGSPAPDLTEVITEGAPSVLKLLATHPARLGPDANRIYLNVFEARRGSATDRVRAEVLDTLVRGIAAILFARTTDERIPDALLTTAFGADPVSTSLRGEILGLPEPIDPHPELDLLDDRIERLVIWGTLRELIRAMQRYGLAVGANAEWSGRAQAHANGIASLSPARGCAGDHVAIRGTGFGASQPAHTTVRFPTEDGGCIDVEVVTRSNGSRAWSDTEIVVVAPAGVGIGCVGFLVTDGPQPSDPNATFIDVTSAAGMVQSVLADAFGAQGAIYGQVVVNVAARATSGVSLPCPPCLPAGGDGSIANRFAGGPPKIRAFTVNGVRAVSIHPEDQITLAWQVENADSVTITTRTAASSAWPAELVPAPGVAARPAIGSAGPFSVGYDGYDDWDGEYVLAATNSCTTKPTVETVRVEMREKQPLFGVVDTHVHFAGHLAFGGYGVWGRPHASNPALTGDTALADALPWCDGPRGHGPGGVLPSLEGAGGHLVGGWNAFDGWPRYTTLAHQQAYVDWIKRAVDGGLRLAVCLASNSELVGTRMTELQGSFLAIDDTSTMTRQFAAMQLLVDFVDAQSGGPGRGWIEIARTPIQARQIVDAGRLALVLGVEFDTLGGWRTPAALDADATATGQTPRQLIANMVQALYDSGVRHVFPVHGTNNAFGGPALFVRAYDAANFFLTGSSFKVEQADPSLGIAYRMDQDVFDGGIVGEVLGYHGIAAAIDVGGAALAGATLGALVGGFAGPPGVITGAVAGGAASGIGAASKYPCPPKPTNWSTVRGGHINAQGLTAHGEILVEELMRRGMIIDIDHMGHKTTEAVLGRCEQQGYPVVSGHSGFRELKYGYQESRCNPTAEFSAGSANLYGTLNPKRMAGEIDKSPAQLERVRKLGGMVSPIAYQHHVHDCGCGFAVANDSAGSSKSFAQAWLYAHLHLHGRRVGFGTDINGAGRLPGPRFGPQGSGAFTDEADWEVRRRLGQPLRVDQVFSQHNAVRYSSPVMDYRHHRFMDYGGQAPFDAEQRDFWEAIAMWKAGVAPETADQPPTVQRTIATQNFIINLATGLRATSRTSIPISITFPPSRPWPFYNVNPDEQLAAFLASHHNPVQPSDPSRTRLLVPKLAKVWAHWDEMERGSATQATDAWTQGRFGPSGSGLYDANGNLHRSVAGRRDFDINIDGVAHYGMLPDLFQDMRNIGVPPQTMAALYRSAEDYIRVWERCDERKLK